MPPVDLFNILYIFLCVLTKVTIVLIMLLPILVYIEIKLLIQLYKEKFLAIDNKKVIREKFTFIHHNPTEFLPTGDKVEPEKKDLFQYKAMKFALKKLIGKKKQKNSKQKSGFSHCK